MSRAMVKEIAGLVDPTPSLPLRVRMTIKDLLNLSPLKIKRATRPFDTTFGRRTGESPLHIVRENPKVQESKLKSSLEYQPEHLPLPLWARG